MTPASETELQEAKGILTVGLLVACIRKWPRTFSLVCVAVIAVIITYALVATPRYRVSIKVLARPSDQASSGLQSLVGQFGGLASLAGISIGGSVDEQEALEWLRSRRLAEIFIERKNLLPAFFAQRWDSGAQRWKQGLKPDEIPTMDAAWIYFDQSVRRVDQNEKTHVITVQMKWSNPATAANWANDYISLANEQLREKLNREIDTSLKFLTEQAKQTPIVDLQQSIYKMMATQINRKVLVNSRPDYAYSVIDPAAVPDPGRFDSPRRRLLILFSLPAGLFFGSCVVLIPSYLRRLMR